MLIMLHSSITTRNVIAATSKIGLLVDSSCNVVCHVIDRLVGQLKDNLKKKNYVLCVFFLILR